MWSVFSSIRDTVDGFVKIINGGAAEEEQEVATPAPVTRPPGSLGPGYASPAKVSPPGDLGGAPRPSPTPKLKRKTPSPRAKTPSPATSAAKKKQQAPRSKRKRKRASPAPKTQAKSPRKQQKSPSPGGGGASPSPGGQSRAERARRRRAQKDLVEAEHEKEVIGMELQSTERTVDALGSVVAALKNKLRKQQDEARRRKNRAAQRNPIPGSSAMPIDLGHRSSSSSSSGGGGGSGSGVWGFSPDRKGPGATVVRSFTGGPLNLLLGSGSCTGGLETVCSSRTFASGHHWFCLRGSLLFSVRITAAPASAASALVTKQWGGRWSRVPSKASRAADDDEDDEDEDASKDTCALLLDMDGSYHKGRKGRTLNALVNGALVPLLTKLDAEVLVAVNYKFGLAGSLELVTALPAAMMEAQLA